MTRPISDEHSAVCTRDMVTLTASVSSFLFGFCAEVAKFRVMGSPPEVFTESIRADLVIRKIIQKNVKICPNDLELDPHIHM